MRPACVAALAVAALWARADVVVFTLSSIPVESRGAPVHVLDESARLADALGAGLPADPQAALAEVRRRLASADGRAVRGRLEAAAAGNALAARLGIEKLPAVVVDRRYVVYGVRDVRRAVDRVAAWRARHETVQRSGPGAFTAPPPGRHPARSLPETRGAPPGERP